MTTAPSFFVIMQERDEAMLRLAIAVAALRRIEINDDCYESAPIASEALARIEESK